MYDRILIPTDGSEGALAAARHGLALATTFESQVHLLSVVDERTYSSSIADVDSAVRDQREAFERAATEAVRTLEELADETPVTCHTAVEHGVPHAVIASYLDRHDIDLVSMGTHGRTGLDRLLVGSVTERIVRTSDVPVLTTRPEADERDGYDRVLIPTDGSEAAAAAIEHGLAVADRYDARVHALSVVDVSGLLGAPDVGMSPDLVDAWTEYGERAVSEVAERAADRGLDVTTAVEQGLPYRAILDYTRQEGIDLVTMGTQGRTGLERYLLGSVTERVVRTSDVPVLTVR
ncbi:universal stress protein [Halococcus sp. IIIV-5B]|uniref:universal stress protein n=1 Tax=Halococcus sp. IIIV-5B TaxID=2321230 RepID=UPI000E716688|nr:universal stress protein [Halococcus sp. IIIV-5B]RJS97636.1 universal stress protein [Halococcus sp. IIIV-5B]